eukprot:gene4207-3039_t
MKERARKWLGGLRVAEVPLLTSIATGGTGYALQLSTYAAFLTPHHTPHPTRDREREREREGEVPSRGRQTRQGRAFVLYTTICPHSLVCTCESKYHERERENPHTSTPPLRSSPVPFSDASWTCEDKEMSCCFYHPIQFTQPYHIPFNDLKSSEACDACVAPRNVAPPHTHENNAEHRRAICATRILSPEQCSPLPINMHNSLVFFPFHIYRPSPHRVQPRYWALVDELQDLTLGCCAVAIGRTTIEQQASSFPFCSRILGYMRRLQRSSVLLAGSLGPVSWQAVHGSSGRRQPKRRSTTEKPLATVASAAVPRPSAPPVFTVRTEGFGPSEDLVKGVQPHSRLHVEATGLHPRDYEVQRRVLELTMPSLAGVTVQPAGQPPPGTTHDKTLQHVWEQKMGAVANIVIEQVQRRTGLQLESLLAAQDEQARAGSELVIQMLRTELWNAAEAIRQVTGEQSATATAHITEGVVRRVVEQISSDVAPLQNRLIDAVTSTTKMHATANLNAAAELVNKNVEKYFRQMESRLKAMAENIKQAATPPPPSRDPQDDLVVVDGPSMEEQKLDEMHTSLVAAIEQASQQQLEHVTIVLSDMMRDQRIAVENATATAAAALRQQQQQQQQQQSDAKQEEAPEPLPPSVDFTAMEDFIEGALRAASDEIRNSVVGEVSRLIQKSESSGWDDRGAPELVNMLSSVSQSVEDVVRESQQMAGTVASMDDAVSDIIRGQAKALDAVESIKSLVMAQQRALEALQQDMKRVAARGDAPVVPTAETNPLATASVERRLRQLSEHQERLHGLSQQLLYAVDSKDRVMESHIAAAVQSVAELLNDALIKIESATADTSQSPAQLANESFLEETSASIHKIEEGVRKVGAAAEEYHAVLERLQEEAAKTRADNEAWHTAALEELKAQQALATAAVSDISAARAEELRGMLREALGSQTQELRLAMAQGQSPTDDTVEHEAARSAALEQHLASIGASLSDAVTGAVEELKSEMERHRAALESTPHLRVPAPATEGETSDAPTAAENKDRLDTLQSELISVVREEIEKIPAADLGPVYKYIDSVLLFIREELSSHQATTEQQVEKVSAAVTRVLEEALEKAHAASPAREPDSLQQHSDQLHEILEATRGVAEELKRSREVEAPPTPAPLVLPEVSKMIDSHQELKASLEQLDAKVEALPGTLTQASDGASLGLKTAVEAMTSQTTASLTDMQNRLAALPTMELIQQQLEVTAEQVVQETHQSFAVAVASAVDASLTKERGISAEIASAVTAASERHTEQLMGLQQKIDTRHAETLEALKHLDSAEKVKVELQTLSSTLSSSIAELDPAEFKTQLEHLEEMVKSSTVSQQENVETLKEAIAKGLEGLSVQVPQAAAPTPAASSTEAERQALQTTTAAMEKMMMELKEHMEQLNGATTTMTNVALTAPTIPTTPAPATAAPSAALETLQSSVERIGDQLEDILGKIMELNHEPSVDGKEETAARHDEIQEQLKGLTVSMTQLVESQQFQEGQLQSLSESVKQQLEEVGKQKRPSKKGSDDVASRLTEGMTKTLADLLAPLRESLTTLEARIEDGASHTTQLSESLDGTAKIVNDVLDRVSHTAAALQEINAEMAKNAASHTTLLEGITDSTERISTTVQALHAKDPPQLDTSSLLKELMERLSVMRAEMEAAQLHLMEERVIEPMNRRWEAAAKETRAALQESVGTIAAAQSESLRSAVEGVREEFAQESQALRTAVSETMERSIAAQQEAGASMKAVVAQEIAGISRALPNAVSAEVTSAVSATTTKMLGHLQEHGRMLQEVAAAAAAAQSPKPASVVEAPLEAPTPAYTPPAPTPSLAMRALMFALQTLGLCLTVLGCFYYMVAALLLVFVPKPVVVDEACQIAPRKAKRVADQIYITRQRQSYHTQKDPGVPRGFPVLYFRNFNLSLTVSSSRTCMARGRGGSESPGASPPPFLYLLLTTFRIPSDSQGTLSLHCLDAPKYLINIYICVSLPLILSLSPASLPLMDSPSSLPQHIIQIHRIGSLLQRQFRDVVLFFFNKNFLLFYCCWFILSGSLCLLCCVSVFTQDCSSPNKSFHPCLQKTCI